MSNSSSEEVFIDLDYLASLVEERPILWDQSRWDYKKKNLKAKAWEQVTKILFPEYDEYTLDEKNKIGNSVVKKWRNMKDSFYKCLKKLKDSSRSGSAANKLTKYHYYNQLLFLTKVAQNTTDGSINVPEESNMSYTNDDIPEPSCYVPVTRKRTAAQMDDFEKETLKALKEPQNRHMSFFKGILPSIEDFNEHETLTFQTKVLQLITELRYKQMSPPSSSYRNEEPSSHEYQSTNPTYNSTQSQSNIILSTNQDSPDGEDIEFDFINFL